MRYRIPSNAEQLPDPTSLQPWLHMRTTFGRRNVSDNFCGNDGTVESTIKVVMATGTGDGFARQQPCWPWPDIQKAAG
ncbi:hypothetical protein LY76DRAFT_591350 [Colletotrichum caudatum]|nr:hypothetical protein LY76DRAFT_591350 [Colletotrichum caudatum]